MKTGNYQIPMEIIIEVSKSLHDFGIRAELNGGDDESGIIYLKIYFDPKSPVHGKVKTNVHQMIQTFLYYRNGNDENHDSQKEAA